MNTQFLMKSSLLSILLLTSHLHGKTFGVFLPKDHPVFNFKISKAVSAYLKLNPGNNIIFKSLPFDMGHWEKTAVDLKDDIDGITGPYLPQYALSLVPFHLKTKMPLVTLGMVTDSPEFKNTQIKRMSNLAQSQVNTLIPHLKKFIIMVPQDSYGYEFSEYLKKTYKEPFEIYYYNPDLSSYQELVKKIITEQIKNESKEQSLILKEKKKESLAAKKKFDIQKVKFKKHLKIDQILILDTFPQVQKLISTFAYHDVENVQFIGDLQWNQGMKPSYMDSFLQASFWLTYSKGNNYSKVHDLLKEDDMFIFQAYDSLIYLETSELKETSLKYSGNWTSSGEPETFLEIKKKSP